MNIQSNYTKTDSETNRKSISKRIVFSWILGLFALGFSSWAGAFAEKHWSFVWQSRIILQAVLMSSITILGIWLLRKKIDKGNPKTIGLNSLKPAVLKFLLGMGIILVPIIITLLTSFMLDSNMITYTINLSILKSSAIGIGIVFLFEALPEELIFRGYIYSNLNSVYVRWKSALFTVLLFVLLPTLLVPIQKHVLGMDVYLGGQSFVSLSYIITMLLFGFFVQYLRILSKSVWVGIGFHMLFVYFDRIMGTTSDNLIQLNTTGSELPLQIAFIGSLLLVFIIVILFPKISKRNIGWKEIQK
ncbi:MAG: hypothetical protein DA407_10080 [Bacteroidetes bacterium]|nr:MAG: hypothetical protein DA407_10080 [Bacteroidota bacterium]